MVGMEEIKEVCAGTGFAEALFEGFVGFACAVGGCGGVIFFQCWGLW